MKPILYLSLFLFSCAHIVPPEGGKRDTQAPKVLKTIPEQNSLNVKPSKLTLYFDEFIDLKEARKNISLTPDIDFYPSFKIIKKRLYLELPSDSFKNNTTYTLNFGKSIVDINESNVLEDYTFSFSTGNQLDTLSIFGTVVKVKENKSIENALVLFKKTDNDLRYSTKSSASGSWKLKNLSPGTYYFTIHSDKNLNKKLDIGELYYKRTLEIKTNQDLKKIILIPYTDYDSIKLEVVSVNIIDDNTLGIKFSRNLKNIHNIKYSLLDGNNKKQDPLIETNRSDSFHLLHPFTENDTLQLKIFTDTLQVFLLVQKEKRKKRKNEYSINDKLIRKGDPIIVNSIIPFDKIDINKVLFNQSLKASQIEKKNPYQIHIFPPSFESTDLFFSEGAFTDINGDQNTSDTIKDIRFANTEQTGNLEFSIMDSTLTSEVDLMVKLFNEKHEFILKTKYNQVNKLKELLPGKYSLEVWEDLNKNEKWDAGNYYKNEDPEKTILLIDFITIKENWDNLGVEIYMD